MPRFLVLVLAVLLPLQSAMAVAAFQSCTVHPGGSQTQTTRVDRASGLRGCAAAGGSSAPRPAADHHLTCHYLPLVFPGVPATATAAEAAPRVAPRSASIAFESIVLDVPSPPPLAA